MEGSSLREEEEEEEEDDEERCYNELRPSRTVCSLMGC